MLHRKTILVIEDEIGMIHLLTAILNAEGYRTMCAKTGKDGIQFQLNHNPDLILLDLGLPDIDGIEILQEIRRHCSTPVIVISARHDEEDKVKALDRGANDYMTKPFGNSELLARIRGSLRLQEQLVTGLMEQKKYYYYSGLHIDYKTYKVSINDEQIHLTPTEYKIIAYLSKCSGRVMTHEQIINQVWGPNNCNDQVLRVNMANIRRKIEQNPADPIYILTELGVGYWMEETSTLA